MRVLMLILVCCTMAEAAEPAPKTEQTKVDFKTGWIDLVDGTTCFGWTFDGPVTIADGVLTVGGDKKATLTWNQPAIPGVYTFELNETGKWEDCKLTLSAKGKGTFDRREKSTARFADVFTSTVFDKGFIQFSTDPNITVKLKNIRYKPLDAKPLFNGKDLTGWKENMAKKASVFSVTKDGYLNVKNGPGDLQTTDQFANFVLQLECISNGKHLNSGIFFRCIPEQYQQGYEAQIRNEWMGDDRTKPVDFGTGAIYRRIASRKVVSTDGEWFTMTIITHGKRLSTWVNGYQTVDWLDERKEADNGRNGAKTTKGAISIQGHDPTTDLSFRNIRIVNLD